jgi:hypothetical protein
MFSQAVVMIGGGAGLGLLPLGLALMSLLAVPAIVAANAAAAWRLRQGGGRHPT